MTTNIQSLLEVMNKMKEAEMKVGELYLLCANKWKEDKHFWIDIAGTEAKHAEYLQQMMDMIITNPNKFSYNRPFNITAVETMIKFVKKNIERLNKDEITKDNMLFIARDFENSVIEQKYVEIIDTLDLKYKELMNRIVEETFEHRKMLIDRINISCKRGC
ncbi:MAG: hypothetical protein WC955_00250 [Elusimicrobiota bacterium]